MTRMNHSQEAANPPPPNAATMTRRTKTGTIRTPSLIAPAADVATSAIAHVEGLIDSVEDPTGSSGAVSDRRKSEHVANPERGRPHIDALECRLYSGRGGTQGHSVNAH